jgi:hypothetical protein
MFCDADNCMQQVSPLALQSEICKKKAACPSRKCPSAFHATLETRKIFKQFSLLMDGAGAPPSSRFQPVDDNITCGEPLAPDPPHQHRAKAGMKAVCLKQGQ